MQTKDIPDSLILNYLDQHQGRWTMLFGTKFKTWVGNQIVEGKIFPEDMPHKLAHSKMKSLHRRGLVSGCPCGCRGDFEITDKGLKAINRPRVREFTGY